MRVTTTLLLSLMLVAGSSLAEDPKPAAKKSEKSKPAAKSDKNIFQKTESSVGDRLLRSLSISLGSLAFMVCAALLR